jgi:hypothetical protein
MRKILTLIQEQGEDFGKNQARNPEESLQRFLVRKEGGKSFGYNDYSNALSKAYDIPIFLKTPYCECVTVNGVEKYALNHKILVLENRADSIKLAFAEPTKYIKDEFKRNIPLRKRIECCLAIPDEGKLRFGKYYNPFFLPIISSDWHRNSILMGGVQIFLYGGLDMISKGTILIVDDEFGPRESLRMILKPIYEVHTAPNGLEALNFISQKKWT